MTELTVVRLVVLPVGLGLLGFIEPCSIGSSLLLVKYLDGQGATHKLAQICRSRSRMLDAERPSVSRVPETGTHGLKGGYWRRVR